MPTGRLRSLPTDALVSLASQHLLEVQIRGYLTEQDLRFSRRLYRELERRNDFPPPHLESCVCESCSDAFWDMVLELEPDGPFD